MWSMYEGGVCWSQPDISKDSNELPTSDELKSDGLQRMAYINQYSFASWPTVTQNSPSHYLNIAFSLLQIKCGNFSYDSSLHMRGN